MKPCKQTYEIVERIIANGPNTSTELYEQFEIEAEKIGWTKDEISDEINNKWFPVE